MGLLPAGVVRSPRSTGQPSYGARFDYCRGELVGRTEEVAVNPALEIKLYLAADLAFAIQDFIGATDTAMLKEG